MAEDFRDDDPAEGQLTAARDALIRECEREEENALYTSTTFFIWLRCLMAARVLLWVGGAAGSIIAASHILRGDAGLRIWIAAAALAGVLLPGIGRAMRLDAAIKNYGKSAGAFKILQGEFRRARLVWSHKPFLEFETEARKLFKAMNDARKPSLVPPECCFRLARWKIQKGHYVHDADEARAKHGS